MSCTPLAKWDDPAPEHQDLVWCARLDNRYQIEVQRIAPQEDATQGVWCIFDHQDNMQCLLEKEVELAFGAVMGPDSNDVLNWMNTAEQVVFAHQSYQ